MTNCQMMKIEDIDDFEHISVNIDEAIREVRVEYDLPPD